MSDQRENSGKDPLQKTIVLVGLMGAGKSTVGMRLAKRLGVEFIDADDEIVAAADMSIPEIFELFGEEYFRDGERRVIARLLDESPCVLATGGGAFMVEGNRKMIKSKGISIWLKADLNTLWDRVRGKGGRPLLENDHPKTILSNLLDLRYPVYELADITVYSEKRDPHEVVVDAIVKALEDNANFL